MQDGEQSADLVSAGIPTMSTTSNPSSKRRRPTSPEPIQPTPQTQAQTHLDYSDSEEDYDELDEGDIEREPEPGEKVIRDIRGSEEHSTTKAEADKKGPRITLTLSKNGKGKSLVLEGAVPPPPTKRVRKKPEPKTDNEPKSKKRKTAAATTDPSVISDRSSQGPSTTSKLKSTSISATNTGLEKTSASASPRRASSTVKKEKSEKSDRAYRRPPPLEMSSGTRELPPPSAGMMSSMRNTGMVSPVVSGFPLHHADNVTREAFRNSMAIKDAQRALISQRRLGKAPPPNEAPGEGPPPSAGPLPTLLTYTPTPASGVSQSNGLSVRRGDGAKNKIKNMRLNTGDMSSVRDGLRTAPAGRFEIDTIEMDELDSGDENEAREAAGYDEHGKSYYDMEREVAKKRNGRHAGSMGRSYEQDVTVDAAGSLRNPISQQVPDERRGSYYPLPLPTPHHPAPAPAQIQPIPQIPYERERETFLSHFSKFYDALLDSTQLRNDLATKIHKANELVNAHQLELRKVEALRVQYETALADLKVRSEGVFQGIKREEGIDGGESV